MGSSKQLALVYELAAVRDERRKPELGTQSIRTAQDLPRHIRFPTGPYGQQQQMGSSKQMVLVYELAAVHDERRKPEPRLRQGLLT